MSNVFLDFASGGGSVALDDGTVPIFVSTVRSSALEPDKIVRTNGTKQLVSSDIHPSDVRGLQDALDSKADQSDLTALENRVTSAEDDITTVEGNISSLEGRVSTTEGNIDSLEGRVSTTENDVDSLENRTTTLEDRVSSAEGNIDSLENRTTTTEDRVSTAEDNIQDVDGRLVTVENKTQDVQITSGNFSYTRSGISYIQARSNEDGHTGFRILKGETVVGGILHFGSSDELRIYRGSDSSSYSLMIKPGNRRVILHNPVSERSVSQIVNDNQLTTKAYVDTKISEIPVSEIEQNISNLQGDVDGLEGRVDVLEDTFEDVEKSELLGLVYDTDINMLPGRVIRFTPADGTSLHRGDVFYNSTEHCIELRQGRSTPWQFRVYGQQTHPRQTHIYDPRSFQEVNEIKEGNQLVTKEYIDPIEQKTDEMWSRLHYDRRRAVGSSFTFWEKPEVCSIWFSVGNDGNTYLCVRPSEEGQEFTGFCERLNDVNTWSRNWSTMSSPLTGLPYSVWDLAGVPGGASSDGRLNTSRVMRASIFIRQDDAEIAHLHIEAIREGGSVTDYYSLKIQDLTAY